MRQNSVERFQQLFFPVASSGPLLYHYENMANELSIELCYEDIKAAMIKFGFHIEVSYGLTYISGLTGCTYYRNHVN